MNLRRILLTSIFALLATSMAWAVDLTDNLVSVWNLSEASGNALDAHGLNELAQTGTIGTATGKVYATARSFERVNVERFTINDNVSLSCGSGVSVTMGAWVKLATDPGAGNYMMIFSKDDSATNREYYLGFNGSTDKLEFQTWNNGSAAGPAVVETATTVTTGTWYFVQAGFDATDAKIWIRLNNSAPVTASQTLIYNGGASFRIGSNGQASPAHAWNGEIGPAFFYKRTVSGGELLQHFNAGNGLVYNAFGVNVSHWIAAAAATPSVGGVPKVDISHIAGQTATVASTPIDANVTKFGGSSGTFSGGRPEVNTTHLSGNTTAADQLAEVFDNDSIGGDMDLTSLVVNNPSGSAVSLTGGGVGGNGLEITGSGTALAIAGGGSSGSGVSISGSGTGSGILAIAGATGTGLFITGGSTSGDAIYASATSGDGMDINGGGTTGHGALFTRGGTSGDDMAFSNADVGVVNDIKAKTDFLPSATAGSNGGLATLDANLNVQADLEAINDDTDTAPNAEKFFDGNGYGPFVLRTTVSAVGSQTDIVMAAGSDLDFVYEGCYIVIRDNSDPLDFVVGLITAYDYDSGARLVTFDPISVSTPTMTIGTGDIVEILPP